jgi:hypothetical protein
LQDDDVLHKLAHFYADKHEELHDA